MDLSNTPEPVEQPGYIAWLAARRLSQAHEAAAFGMTRQNLGRYLKPFDHPGWTPPPVELMRKVYARTGGEITLLDWFPRDLHPARETVSAATAWDDAHRPLEDA